MKRYVPPEGSQMRHPFSLARVGYSPQQGESLLSFFMITRSREILCR